MRVYFYIILLDLPTAQARCREATCCLRYLQPRFGQGPCSPLRAAMVDARRNPLTEIAPAFGRVQRNDGELTEPPAQDIFERGADLKIRWAGARCRKRDKSGDFDAEQS
jgi:hypothetical protein